MVISPAHWYIFKREKQLSKIKTKRKKKIKTSQNGVAAGKWIILLTSGRNENYLSGGQLIIHQFYQYPTEFLDRGIYGSI